MRLLTLVLFCCLSPWLQAETQTIDEFTQGMDSREGYFTLFHDPDKGKIYLHIDAGRGEFLFQSSLPKGIGSNDIGLDRGQLGQTRLVQFERFGDKVLLKQLNTEYRAITSSASERASIDEAFADSVIAGLPIVAQQPGAWLVDYTDFLLSDIHRVSERLSGTKQGSYKVDAKRSGVYWPKSKAFADNTEMEALVTFAGTKPGQFVQQVVPSPESITVHKHHSLIRLPDDNYRPRAFHPYSGFWSVAYQDYATPIDQGLTQRYIPRHRLEKRNPDARYSDPVEPIVYYLDPGTPEPVKSALKEGALWWNKAFERIGFTNAFQVKDLPADADPMDVRYNVIQWVHRATRGWSYGYSVIDPRTGEIIKGHVTLGSLRVRQDYLIALGLTSPFQGANGSTEAQKQMALARIRQLSAHEVGHTLGLAHNFAASENDRASVMDYPHPLVRLLNGQIRLDDAYAVGMGEWDYHTIAYGYQTYADPDAEANGLNGEINAARNRGLNYLSDPDARGKSSASASAHLWDNGASSLEEIDNLFAVREQALAQFGINSLPTGASLSSLEERLVPIYLMHRYQLEAVAKLVGGIRYEYELKGDYPKPKGVIAVNATEQLKAMDALLKTLTPTFLQLSPQLLALIPPKAYGEQRNRESFKGRMGTAFDPVSAAESLTAHTLSLMLEPHRLNRLSEQSQWDESKPRVADLVARLVNATVKTNSDTAIMRRVKHLVVDALVKTQADETLGPEAKADVFAALTNMQSWLSQQSGNSDLLWLSHQLKRYFEQGQWAAIKVKPLPPGSPI